MKKLFVAVLSVGMLVVAASSYSFAQMCGPDHGPGPAGMGMHRGERGSMERKHRFSKMLASLGLDEKQKDSIREIRIRVEKETVRKRAEIQVARIDLRAMLSKDQVDMGATEAQLKKIAAMQTEIRLAHIKSVQEIKAVLTPEQRNKWKEMREMDFPANRPKA